MLQFSKSSRKPENQMRNFSSPNAPPRGSPSKKKPSFTFDLPKCSLFYIERDIGITNLSFEILFLFQTEMVRNYHNFMKSNLNFRFSKKMGDFREFWGTSRKKVITHSLGEWEKQIPQTSRNRKSNSSVSSFLKEENLMRNWELYRFKTPCSSNSLVQTFGHNLQHELDIIRAYWPALNS